MPLSIMFSLLPHLCCRKGDREAHVLCHLQYSVIYHTVAVGRGVQGSRGLCHFQYCFSHLPHLCYRQGVQKAHMLCHSQYFSIIYNTCAIGRGVRRVMFFCHFQKCFCHLPLLCCRQGGSGGSCFMPLSVMFQSFTTPVL